MKTQTSAINVTGCPKYLDFQGNFPASQKVQRSSRTWTTGKDHWSPSRFVKTVMPTMQGQPMILKTLKLFHFALTFICLFDASKKLQMVVCLYWWWTHLVQSLKNIFYPNTSTGQMVLLQGVNSLSLSGPKDGSPTWRWILWMALLSSQIG